MMLFFEKEVKIKSIIVENNSYILINSVREQLFFFFFFQEKSLADPHKDNWGMSIASQQPGQRSRK